MRDTPTSDDGARGRVQTRIVETRRAVVTVVFADAVSSTALRERWASRRCVGDAAVVDRMRVAVERHGGTIENYIGDQVMAVFGESR